MSFVYPACVLVNLRALGARLARNRSPERAAGTRGRRRTVLGAGLLALMLIAAFLVFLDPHAPGWRATLSPNVLAALERLTRYGESPWLLIPTGAFCGALLFVNWRVPGRRTAAAWIELGSLVGYVFFAIVVSGMVTNLVKWSLGRSRPMLIATDGPHALNPISFDFAHVSFPSGHSTTAAALAMAVILIFRARPWIVVVGALFALSIAVSRVALQAHYPSDTVAGLFIGSTGAFLLAHALGRRGVAFQVQADGRLMPKTVALRRVLRHGACTPSRR